MSIPRSLPSAARRLLHSALSLGVATALLAACGGATTKTGAASGAPGTAVGATSQSAPPPTGASPSAASSGRSVATYTCDIFPAADVFAAIQALAPKTTAGPTKTESAGSETSPLQCDYSFAPNLQPGIDPAAADNASVTVRLDDGEVGGARVYSDIKQAFEKNRDSLIANADGNASSDTQNLEFPATGLGVEAFFKDYITRSSGIDNLVSSELHILRATLPMIVTVSLASTPQSDSSVAVPALADDPFLNDGRHQMLEAVAKFVLARLSS